MNTSTNNYTLTIHMHELIFIMGTMCDHAFTHKGKQSHAFFYQGFVHVLTLALADMADKIQQ